MAHFAKVENGYVTEVIVAEQDFIDSGAVGDPSMWKQTSINTRNGIHYAPNSDIPDGGVALRGNYAVVGSVYDAENDVFYWPQTYPSWSLNKTTWTWDPPVPMPKSIKRIYWDEDIKNWITE
jgi:hypothetical protein